MQHRREIFPAGGRARGGGDIVKMVFGRRGEGKQPQMHAGYTNTITQPPPWDAAWANGGNAVSMCKDAIELEPDTHVQTVELPPAMSIAIPARKLTVGQLVVAMWHPLKARGEQRRKPIVVSKQAATAGRYVASTSGNNAMQNRPHGPPTVYRFSVTSLGQSMGQVHGETAVYSRHA